MTRVVRVGIIDSGVNPVHPHVGNIMGGVAIDLEGYNSDFHDALGHGTAIAAVIHEKAPQAALFVVKVFHRKLATTLDAILRAVDWCIKNDMDIINLSLGTLNREHRPAFESAVQQICSAGKLIVSAFAMDGVPALPGCLPGVVGVAADPECPRDEQRVQQVEGKSVFVASPFPRPIPGVSPERNLHGISFAVAHITGAIASELLAGSDAATWEERLLLSASAVKC